MANGYRANRERQEEIGALGKTLAKRAGFACEWCGGKNDLRPWDYRPDQEPAEETLALLCARCRVLAEGGRTEPHELQVIKNALWSDVPAVAEGAAGVLARSRQPWVREAIEESLVPDEVKRRLLGRGE